MIPEQVPEPPTSPVNSTAQGRIISARPQRRFLGVLILLCLVLAASLGVVIVRSPYFDSSLNTYPVDNIPFFGNFDPIQGFVLSLVLFGGLGLLFFLMREIILWYWRINDFYELFNKQLGVFVKLEKDLESMEGHLLDMSEHSGTRDLSKKQQPLNAPEAAK